MGPMTTRRQVPLCGAFFRFAEHIRAKRLSTIPKLYSGSAITGSWQIFIVLTPESPNRSVICVRALALVCYYWTPKKRKEINESLDEEGLDGKKSETVKGMMEETIRYHFALDIDYKSNQFRSIQRLC